MPSIFSIWIRQNFKLRISQRSMANLGKSSQNVLSDGGRDQTIQSSLREQLTNPGKHTRFQLSIKVEHFDTHPLRDVITSRFMVCMAAYMRRLLVHKRLMVILNMSARIIPGTVMRNGMERRLFPSRWLGRILIQDILVTVSGSL
jgi:hypothetical protein